MVKKEVSPVKTTFPPLGEASPKEIITMITELNENVRFFQDQRSQAYTQLSPYGEYLYDRLNEERGLIFGEALTKANDQNGIPYFTAALKAEQTEEKPDDAAVVVFRFTDPSRKKGYFKTTARLSEIRFPGKIDSNEDVLTYIEKISDVTEAFPERIVTEPVLMRTMKNIVDIDRFAKQQRSPSDLERDKEKLETLERKRMELLLTTVLPTRKSGNLKNIKVIALYKADAKGKAERNNIHIVLRGPTMKLRTTLFPNRMDKQLSDLLLERIGEFDDGYSKPEV